MGINKNFVVKHGLEVKDDLIYADPDTNRVGINSAIPGYTLDVKGDVGTKTLNVSGIATIFNLVSTASTFNNIDIKNVLSPTIDFNDISANTVDPDVLDLSNSTIRIGGDTGLNGQYLVSTGDGVEWSQVSASRTPFVIEATPGQVLLDNLNYQVGSVDVFINGVKLSNSEFTATDGQNITLSSPCFGDEIIEVISYSINAFTSGDASITGIVTATGGFISVANTSPVKIEVVGNKLTFNVVGIGSTTLTLF